jgi:hypothetical protein
MIKVNLSATRKVSYVKDYPCVLVHQGAVGSGDRRWKDVVVLALSKSEGIYLSCDLIPFKVGEKLTFDSKLDGFNVEYWATPENPITIES